MSGKNIDSLFTDGKLAAITFTTADASFAIPLEQVLYIEKDVKRNLQLNELDEFNHEVITFQNNTVELYDFNKLIGSENHQVLMQKLIATLDQMEQEQQDWVDALELSISTNQPFTKTLDPNKSTFGIWYEKFETDNEELKEVLTRLDSPFKKLYSVGSELLELAKTEQDQALETLAKERLTTLSELIHLFHLTKERALSSIRPIILFVEHKAGKVTALRLDNINDIVTFDRKVFSIDDSAEGIMRSKSEDFYVEGFLRDGNDAPIMLINCQPMDRSNAGQVA